MKRKIETKQPFYRTVPFDRAAVNDTARTVTLSISSDVPYLRNDFFGLPYYEILRHDSAGIVSDRLKAGTALLFNHDTSQHLGRNIEFKNDGHKITVTSKFSRSQFAEEKWQDVQEGILVDSSVGYQILDVEELDEEIDGIPVYRMTWQPLEGSLVTVPADFTVGVGRNSNLVNQRTHMQTKTPDKPVDINEPQENQRTAEQEKERIREIHAIGKRADVPAAEIEKAIENNISSNAFRKYAFENYFGNSKPLLTPWNGDLRGNDSSRQSVARQILTHPEFQKLREGGRKRISFTLPNVRSLHELNRAAVTTTDVGTTVMQVPGVQGVAYERLTVADLLAQGVTNSGKVQYPREESFDPDATTVAEAAAKPEQSFDVSPAESSVRKIAVWTKVSDELVEDSPAAEAYVRARLGFSVRKVEDTQLLSGDGLGTNLLGILSTPGLQTQAKGSDTTLDAIRKGIRSVEENTDFVVTSIVVNVHDWANIEMLKDSQGRYLVGQLLIPDEFGRPRLAPGLWGRPVAVSKGIAQGTVLVGGFSAAAQLFRRTGLMIEATNSNEDDFIRNLILIRAEERLALAVYAGSAFCEVTGLPA